MATHSSTLAWRIPWREEPGRLQSMGSQRVGHHWATSLSLSLSFDWASQLCSGKVSARQGRKPSFHPWAGKIPLSRKHQPTPMFFVWKIPRIGVAKSQTWLITDEQCVTGSISISFVIMGMLIPSAQIAWASLVFFSPEMQTLRVVTAALAVGVSCAALSSCLSHALELTPTVLRYENS